MEQMRQTRISNKICPQILKFWTKVRQKFPQIPKFRTEIGRFWGLKYPNFRTPNIGSFPGPIVTVTCDNLMNSIRVRFNSVSDGSPNLSEPQRQKQTDKIPLSFI